MSKRVILRSIGTAVMMCVLLVVSACGGTGGRTEAPASKSIQGYVFKSVADCMKAGSSEADCSTAFQTAVKEANLSTPSFSTAQDCTQKWGKCERHNLDGQDNYFPMMMAFLILQNHYWPVYGNFSYAQVILSLYNGTDVGYYDSTTSVNINQSTVDEVSRYYTDSVSQVEKNADANSDDDEVYDLSDDGGSVKYDTSDLSQCANTACDTTGADTSDETSTVESGSPQQGVTTQTDPVLSTDNQDDTEVETNSGQNSDTDSSSFTSDSSDDSSYTNDSSDTSSSSSEDTSSSSSSDEGE